MNVSLDRQHHIKSLDIVRGLAAGSVFVSHFVQQFLDVPALGWGGVALELLGVMGVAVFFVLSGFLIHAGGLVEQQRNGRMNWRAYAVRRFFRIYPAYMVALLCGALFSVRWQSNMIDAATVPTVLSHLLLLSSFVPGHFESVNAIFWTVVVECHFYAFYPLLSRILLRRGVEVVWPMVVLLSMGCFFVLTALAPAGPVRVMVQHLAPALFWQWCLGVALAEMWVKGWLPGLARRFGQRWLLWPLLLLSFVGTLAGRGGLELNFKRFVLPFLCAGMVAVVVFSSIRQTRAVFAEWLGEVSYSIYLWHPLALAIVWQLTKQAGMAAGASLALTLLLAALSYYLLEKPSIDLGRRLA